MIHSKQDDVVNCSYCRKFKNSFLNGSLAIGNPQQNVFQSKNAHKDVKYGIKNLLFLVCHVCCVKGHVDQEQDQ
jgi:hypothetical protein